MIDNQGFFARIKTYKFTDEEVRLYTYQLLLAIEHAHSRGVIHCDIKMDNIVIDSERQQLKLIDWGLARYYNDTTTYYHDCQEI